MIDEFREQISAQFKDIIGDRQTYGVIEARRMALYRIKGWLEADLEQLLHNPYSDDNAILRASAKLTLFNSVFLTGA